MFLSRIHSDIPFSVTSFFPCAFVLPSFLNFFPPFSHSFTPPIPPFTLPFLRLLVFRVYYKRPMVIDSQNLKLRQTARFSSNVILDEMSSIFGFFFDCSTRRKTTVPCTYGNFSLVICQPIIFLTSKLVT